jgi:hypothetical protein
MTRVPATAFAPLDRMIQASLLLQIPKQMNNVSVIVDEITIDLTGKQVRAMCLFAPHFVFRCCRFSRTTNRRRRNTLRRDR